MTSRAAQGGAQQVPPSGRGGGICGPRAPALSRPKGGQRSRSVLTGRARRAGAGHRGERQRLPTGAVPPSGAGGLLGRVEEPPLAPGQHPTVKPRTLPRRALRASGATTRSGARPTAGTRRGGGDGGDPRAARGEGTRGLPAGLGRKAEALAPPGAWVAATVREGPGPECGLRARAGLRPSVPPSLGPALSRLRNGEAQPPPAARVEAGTSERDENKGSLLAGWGGGLSEQRQDLTLESARASPPPAVEGRLVQPREQ